MPGSLGPNAHDFDVAVTETVIADADCGLESYEVDTLNRLIDEGHPEQLIAERTLEGWQLVGCSRFTFEAVTPGVDHEELTHRTEDAVLFWKRPPNRSRRS